MPQSGQRPARGVHMPLHQLQAGLADQLEGREVGSQLLLRVLNLADARNADPATPDNALLTVPRPGRAWQLEWQQAF